MSTIFYAGSKKLSFLLARIHNREVVLPDVQREFFWEPRETEELFEGIRRNDPAGGLLPIKNAAGRTGLTCDGWEIRGRRRSASG